MRFFFRPQVDRNRTGISTERNLNGFRNNTTKYFQIARKYSNSKRFEHSVVQKALTLFAYYKVLQVVKVETGR